ncbi:MAG TPA: hypothetical protein VFN50_11755 [Acidimicrobiales bacterium]|nr:hypothetical protein [Acidimicrobiales bacterium]
MSSQTSITTAGMTAAEVVAANEELDRLLLEELGRADLARPPRDDGEWVAVEVAAHLAEFPHFFAGEIERWRSHPGSTVGRTHDDEGRLAAVAAAWSADPSRIRSRVSEALSVLAAALGQLSDSDIAAATRNVKYGEEPLSAFLDRYVIGHKAGHLEQLRALAAERDPRKEPVSDDDER